MEICTNTHVGRDPEWVRQEVKNIMNRRTKKGRIPPLWDGNSGERIAEILSRSFTVDGGWR